MVRFARVACFALLGVLTACDVHVQDETPGQFVANNGAAMYPIKVAVTHDSMVSGDTVYVTAISGDRTVRLEGNGTEFTALLPVHCRGSFPLQYRVVWTIQGISTRSELVPPQPRTVQLTEPPLNQSQAIDTTERSKKGWDGAVHYTFVTAPNTQITAAHLEPVSQDPADVKAAKAIEVTSDLPESAPCGTQTDVALHSKAQQARAILVIDTDNPEDKELRTQVQFSPH